MRSASSRMFGLRRPVAVDLLAVAICCGSIPSTSSFTYEASPSSRSCPVPYTKSSSAIWKPPPRQRADAGDDLVVDLDGLQHLENDPSGSNG
jgi:hypothetical protein